MTTKIEWATETWNPVHGCTPISEACENCYAAKFAKRLAGKFGYPKRPHEFDVTLRPDRLGEPLTWKKPRRVFTVSMGDLFHPDVPNEYISRVYHTMFQASTHRFIVLTKRARRMYEYLNTPEFTEIAPALASDWNVIHGITAENQNRFDERIEYLSVSPVMGGRFVSCEPLLGPLDLLGWIELLDWVICGGETTGGGAWITRARRTKRDWVRSLRDQCVASGTPFFFKKWGSAWWPDTREVDGAIWEQYPKGIA